MRVALWAAGLLFAPTVALACLWDRDTPADEAKGLPDVVAVLTGRFPRNPPLFYEMRLARVEKELAGAPGDLAAYDDAGVACDRLGRGDAAIAWMERKRAQLDRLPADSPERREHEYRYHANLGTFVVHRWLPAGADRGNHFDEVRRARDEIARAIAINTDAHFGREIYQLRFLEWLLDPPVAAGKEPLPNFLGIEEIMIPPTIDPADARKAVIGLSGLIVLGNAWESVDVYNALRTALVEDTVGFEPTREGGRNSLAYYAWLRAQELVAEGKGSILPDAPRGEALAGAVRRPGFDGDIHGLNESYAELRREADAWQEARTRFMTERLATGRHPDVSPDFWQGYSEAPAPPLSTISPYEAWHTAYDYQILRAKLILGGLLAVAVGTVSFFVLRALRRRRWSRPASEHEAW